MKLVVSYVARCKVTCWEAVYTHRIIITAKWICHVPRLLRAVAQDDPTRIAEFREWIQRNVGKAGQALRHSKRYTITCAGL